MIGSVDGGAEQAAWTEQFPAVPDKARENVGRPGYYCRRP
jgi:hypothetical protein